MHLAKKNKNSERLKICSVSRTISREFTCIQVPALNNTLSLDSRKLKNPLYVKALTFYGPWNVSFVFLSSILFPWLFFVKLSLITHTLQ